jgi:hypothetical protein
VVEKDVLLIRDVAGDSRLSVLQGGRRDYEADRLNEAEPFLMFLNNRVEAHRSS